MQFELTKEYLNELRESLDTGLETSILKEVSELHPADIAEILDELTIEQASLLYKYIGKEKSADILIELDEDVRERYLDSIGAKEIAETFIENMDSDDAADIMAELSDKVKEEVISHIQDEEQASDIVDLLSYPEDSAGGLMAKELIQVNVNWSMLKCVKEMRKQAEDIENVYSIYVVDNQSRLIGTLSLKKLLLATSTAKVEDVYFKDVLAVKAYEKSEEVANIMEKYDLVVLPVVDELYRLIGRITIDDVVDVIREEADKDYQMASGLTQTAETSDRVWALSKARIPWLVIGLMGGVLGSLVIENYEGQIQIHPEMAIFIPLIAAMGGNAGVQSSAIVVQGLANKTMGFDSIFSRLFKEFSVGLLNGVLVSALIFAYNLLFSDSWALSLTVSISLITAVVFATLLGTAVPLVLEKYKVDPALATGPFITTLNDIIGLFIYFGVGRLLYNYF